MCCYANLKCESAVFSLFWPSIQTTEQQNRSLLILRLQFKCSHLHFLIPVCFLFLLNTTLPPLNVPPLALLSIKMLLTYIYY